MKKMLISLASLLGLCLFWMHNAYGRSSHLKVLFLGNSITYHPPSPSIGWTGSWGMAADTASEDYVHLLTSKIKQRNPAAQFLTKTAVPTFEKKFWYFDTTEFAEERKFDPDIIIIELGDNVSADSAKIHSYAESLQRLADCLVSGKRKDVRIIVTTTFWGNPFLDRQIRMAAQQRHWIVADLSNVHEIPGSMALGKYKNDGVSKHPSSLGMQRIYEILWESLKRYIR